MILEPMVPTDAELTAGASVATEKALAALGLAEESLTRRATVQVLEFAMPGTYAWARPIGVAALTVELIGSGAGGTTGDAFGGGGGGAGAYARSEVVLDADEYEVIVGAAGAPNTNGESSTFNGGNLIIVSLEAVGGDPGTGEIGGPGGDAAHCSGDVAFSGGAGGTSDDSGSAAGGQAGSADAAGADGLANSGSAGGTGPGGAGASTGEAGRDGNDPGDGGGGAEHGHPPGDGADGLVRLTWAE